jgi:fructan beta-fructosidase
MRKRILYILLLLAIIASKPWSCISDNNNKLLVESGTPGYYGEKYRPQFHFSPETGWMNDPNGLVFLDGEYHLFYQYFPDSTVWGPMHWGHAVSRDLVHCTHLPVALCPDSLGLIFSGSTVVDEGNTAGFGNNGNPAIVAVFTYHNPKLEGSGSDRFQSQGIAYSTDKGRTWTKFSGNPVLSNTGKRDFRDPKVFRYDATGKWIMILAVHDRVHIYSSADLKNWSFESEFGNKAGAHGGVWECPDLFPLKVEGSDVTKWVMLVSINPGSPNGGSATQYFTGSFDGNLFVPDVTNEKWLDWGTDNYAGVTWSGIPETDGRRLFIGWMSNWNYATVVPTTVWRSAMTIPRKLSLIREKENYSLVSEPVRELDTLQSGSTYLFPGKEGKDMGENNSIDGLRLNQCKLNFEFRIGIGFNDTLGLILENEQGEKFIAGYSGSTKQVFIDRTKSGDSSFSKGFASIVKAPYEASEVLKMTMFIDAASAELFVDDGKLVMTTLFFPNENYSKLSLFSGKENVLLRKAEFHEFASIWR